MHLTHIVCHVLFFDLEHTSLDTWLAEVLDERLTLRHPLVGAEEEEEAFPLLLLILAADLLLGVDEELLAELALCFDDGLYIREELLKELVIPLGYRARDDQWRTSIVDEDGVYFVHDRIVMLALNKVFGARSHVITEVVEAELIVRTEGDVRIVGSTAFRGIGAVLVDAVYTQTMEHVEWSHPLGVTLGEVVIHRHHVHPIAREGIEEDWECRYQRLPFPCGHFGDLPLVEYRTPKELYIIVYHIPEDLITTSDPVVLVDGGVSLDAYEVMREA